MKKQFVLIVFLCLILSGFAARSQMVGDCVFLQGNFLEIGISPIGAYGSSQPAPISYHPTGAYTLWDPGSSTYVGTRLLGFVADPAMDGWATGAPPLFGDYFLPGTPQEGWSIQANGSQSDAWTQALSFPGTGYSGTLSGGTVSYSSTGGISKGVWSGSTADPLQITQTTMLNSSKLYFTVHVVIRNTGGSTANNVYYQRTVDPDNAEQQYGIGDFTTINKIEYQLPNPDNKVMVSATSPTNSTAYLGLGTKDCRAKCYIINSGLTPTYNLNQVYAQTTPYMYTTGTTYTNDVGIGLVYNLGSIAPGDSTDLTYAYVLRAADLDSALALTAPSLTAHGSLILPGSDTIDACALGLDSVFVSIGSGGSYTWVWSPATGLTSTTGTSSTVLVDSLTGIITYTVIGTPISSGICTSDTFHFTIIPGTSAGPVTVPVVYCQFDTADTLVATGTNLRWYTSATGGTGSTSSPTPSTMTAGIYTWWVTQTIGSCGESIRVPITVTVNAKPNVTAGSNSPVCTYSLLNLTATDTLTSGATYAWTGPLSFTSTLQNPSVTVASVTATGWYHVTVDMNGCTDTDSTYVIVHQSPIITGPTMTPPSACNVSDGCMTIYGLTPDSAYAVFYSFNGGALTYHYDTADVMGRITICGLHAGIYSSIYVVNGWGCASNVLSITLPDGAAPAAPTASSNGPICADSTLLLFASDTATGVTYHWTGPNGFTSTLQNPVITGATTAASGTYYVIVTVNTTGCSSAAGSVSVLVKPTPTLPVVSTNSPVCSGSDLALHASSTPSGAIFTWTGPSSYTATGSDPVLLYADTLRSGVYTVVATLSGCPSLPASVTATVNPIPPMPVTTDLTYCQYDPATPLTATGSSLTWYATISGSSIPTPTPGTAIPGTTTYYVTQTVLGCESPRAPLHVTVNTKPVVNINPARSYICHGDTLTLNFSGPVLTGATYLWTMPAGATIISGSDTSMGPIVAQFDSAGNNVVTLTVTANGCSTTGHYTVHVAPTPVIDAYIAPDICVGDTTLLGLTFASPGIDHYSWSTDSTHFHVISAMSGTGGPFTVSWDTAGMYIISVTGYSTQESCPTHTIYDSVLVHGLPDATFSSTDVTCTGDTALFTAHTISSSNSYAWAPAGYFLGITSAPSVYGVVMAPGYISLTVTDPFGCHSTDSLLYSPSYCCSIDFPTAFTPNNDGHNDVYKPITDGHHMLSVFRIVNRWGVTVYSTASTEHIGWDGTFGGAPQDMGTYYWYIRYTCEGHTVERSGDLTLIR